MNVHTIVLRGDSVGYTTQPVRLLPSVGWIHSEDSHPHEHLNTIQVYVCISAHLCRSQIKSHTELLQDTVREEFTGLCAYEVCVIVFR